MDGAWDRAMLALRLLAADPGGLRGVLLRARAGPVRDAFLAQAERLLGRLRRIPPCIAEDQLAGGVDFEASLAQGRLVHRQGLLTQGGPFVLPGGDRCSAHLAAKLAAALDRGQAFPLLVLDEAAEEAEVAPATLADRLALHVDLSDLALAECTAPYRAPAKAASVAMADDHIAQIARLADALGVDSPRAGCLALRAAQATAASDGRDAIEISDLEVSAALVLAPRATRLPAPAAEDATPETTPPTENGDDTGPSKANIGDDVLIAAATALLPPDLLDRVAARRQSAAKGVGSGAALRSKRGGRPLPSRPGRLGGRTRIDLVATLRAATPWQRIRRKALPGKAGILFRNEDIRLKRYEERSDRLLIFSVDASGSAAMARLAETKGAVELLLARAHSRRDHVALIAFRGDAAQVLLPPTRSLVRTKRELAQLPGGGTTPLAAGLKAAAELARVASDKGMMPVVALLTDGRGNVALDGSADRTRAGADAKAIARAFVVSGTEVMVIDTGTRPHRELRDLAGIMRGDYLSLPRGNSSTISDAVAANLDA